MPNPLPIIGIKFLQLKAAGYGPTEERYSGSKLVIL